MKRFSKIRFLLAAIGGFVPFAAAHAIDRVVMTAPCNLSLIAGRCQVSIQIAGEISHSTANEFQSIIDREVKRTALPIKPMLDISSPGGDVYAAMRIGRELRQNLGYVEAGISPRICYSACVFIAADAVSRTAFVGIHRPYFVQASAATLAETDSRYKKLMADVHAYLREMNMPESVFQLMETIRPDELRKLSTEEGKRMGFIGEDPAYQEVEIAGEARMYGLSSAEYRNRLAQMDSVCGTEDSAPDIAIRDHRDVIEVAQERAACARSHSQIMWGTDAKTAARINSGIRAKCVQFSPASQQLMDCYRNVASEIKAEGPSRRTRQSPDLTKLPEGFVLDK